MTLDEAKQFLEDNAIGFVLAQFVDIHGSAKTKAVPVSHFEDLLTTGAGFAGFAIWGLGMGPHGPEYTAMGDLATLSLVSWMPGYARIACDGHVLGKPYEYCPRVALRAQLRNLEKLGWTMYTGIEPEFMLLERAPDGSLAPHDATDALDKPCYDYKGLARSSEFLRKLVTSLQAAGLDVYQIDHEDANGQFEVNFTYRDCLTTADNYVLFKMAASEIAHGLGMICTFMPKPFSNRTGTGSHFHISIGDAGNDNIFADDKDKEGLGLSRVAYQFLAGILDHARGLAALAAPSINSYKRLVVGRSLSGSTWAPAYITYGNNNRTAMVRVPGGRLELRLPDGSCNPYLVTAGIIAAGLDGVRRGLDPGKPNNTDLYLLTPEQVAEQGIGILPQNLSEAIDGFAADHVLREAVGENLAQEFIRLKRMEWIEYSRHVSAWETQRYLEFF
ncbi:MAG TPA: type III glutamate--ammonia ligase [Casimicrobiaceae bacterium]|nr:type III glutamate--ammonia ligase [Casimicrobiaceae bacterium]